MLFKKKNTEACQLDWVSKVILFIGVRRQLFILQRGKLFAYALMGYAMVWRVIVLDLNYILQSSRQCSAVLLSSPPVCLVAYTSLQGYDMKILSAELILDYFMSQNLSLIVMVLNLLWSSESGSSKAILPWGIWNVSSSCLCLSKCWDYSTSYSCIATLQWRFCSKYHA